MISAEQRDRTICMHLAMTVAKISGAMGQPCTTPLSEWKRHHVRSFTAVCNSMWSGGSAGDSAFTGETKGVGLL